jgi:tetratricopeptide (TPR) repeat protein
MSNEKSFYDYVILLQTAVQDEVSNQGNKSTVANHIHKTIETNLQNLVDQFDGTVDSLKAKFLHKDYIDCLKGDIKVNQCVPSIGIITSFLDTKFEKDSQINISIRFDAMAVFLGFEGWLDGKNYHFNIQEKSKSIIQDKNDQASNKDLDGNNRNSTNHFSHSEELNSINESISRLFSPEYIIKKSELEFNQRLTKWVNVKIESLEHKSQNRPDDLINDLFDELCEVQKLQPHHRMEIDSIVDREIDPAYDWTYRAILADAISLSLLNSWDRFKVRYLCELAQFTHETIVSERAIIGLTIALLASINLPKLDGISPFKQTTSLIHNKLKNIKGLEAGIFETFDFLTSNFESYNILQKNEELDFFLEKLKLKYSYQWFEPFSPKASYISVENNVLKSSSNSIHDFFQLINSFIYLNRYKQVQLFFQIRSLSKARLNELKVHFRGEKKRLEELESSVPYECIKFKYSIRIQSFLSSLDENQMKKLRSLVNGINKFNTAEKFSKAFPYHRFLKYIHQSENDWNRFKLSDSKQLNDLGFIFFQNRELDNAWKASNAAVKIDPKEIGNWLFRGLLHTHNNDIRNALKSIKIAASIESDYQEIWIVLASYYLRIEDYDSVQNCIEKADQIDPNTLDLWHIKGELHSKKGEINLALSAFEKAIELNPSSVMIWVKKGNIHRKQNEFEEALNAYDIATTIDPYCADAWYERGMLNLDKKIYYAALDSFDAATSIEPDNSIYWLVKAITMKREGKSFGLARKAFEKAADLDPNFPTTWFNKGLFHEDILEYDLALESYKKATELNSSYLDAWEGQSITLFKSGQFMECKTACEATLLLNRMSKIANMCLASSEFSLGNFEKALNYYKSSLGLYEDFEEFFKALNRYFFYLKKHGITPNELRNLKESLNKQYISDNRSKTANGIISKRKCFLFRKKLFITLFKKSKNQNGCL